MYFFGICFILYFIKMSSGQGLCILMWTGFQKFSGGGRGGVRRSQPRSDFFLDPRLRESVVYKGQFEYCF